jgi:hypothetical protein
VFNNLNVYFEYNDLCVIELNHTLRVNQSAEIVSCWSIRLKAV